MSVGETKPETQPAEAWAVVEVMGHDRACGRISEVVQFGVPMLRVDVPAVNGRPAFTKDFSGAAIFSITRTTKELATAAASRMYVREPEILGLPAPATDEPPDGVPDTDVVYEDDDPEDDWDDDEYDEDRDEERY